ncbi:spore germination protein [Paenibacillus sp. HWE-109]|uniref:GerAB/ArcD/ProY family transporter n=1 Tax=Paenibacillus sp. HWE-109 TaxID=1306526 RepID=UPI001EDCDA78|nr:endospore germination permease [Paenibacillus sp. HWE-109]UKS28748.1 spore germination protein [Paenibacillus sp. HWE-109]
MGETKNKISSTQLAFFTIQTAIGEGALTLPFTLHAISSGDGWISLLLAGLTTQIIIVLIWGICRRYPELTLMDILPKLVGKLVGRVISVLFIAYFTALASIVLLNYTRIISSWIFPTTPRWVIMALMMFTTFYLAKESLRMIARFEVLLSSILVILLGLVMFPLFKGNVLYLLPIGLSGSWPIIKGIENAAIAMAGFELMFVIYPQIQSKDRTVLKTMMLSYVIITTFYLIIVISCFVFFSPKEMDIVPEPVLYMLKAVSFRFFERTDLIFLSFWVPIVMTSIANYVFFAATSIQKLLKVNQPTLVTFIVVMVCWLLVLIPSDVLQMEKINKWFSKATLIMIYGLPILLFAVTVWKHRKNKTVVE